MSQYHPTHYTDRYPELARPITAAEYNTAEISLAEAGIENGWVQDLAAPEFYLPDFGRPGHPFEKTSPHASGDL
jgi:putative pyruvate formate lyase activating enzyme